VTTFVEAMAVEATSLSHFLAQSAQEPLGCPTFRVKNFGRIGF
jgi:hypothetical protein